MKSEFKFHDTLNPDFWDGFDLKPEVRKKLLEAAKEFHRFLKIKAKIRDVIITGSSSNFNYSKKYSDLDLHILYQFDDVLGEAEDDEVIKTERDLIEEYLMTRKSLWNENYDIKIKGTDVELYPQDVDEKHFSSGTFSVARNKWIVKPEKNDVDMDMDSAMTKAKVLMRQIDNVIDNNQDTKKIKDKIKKFRQSGLESEESEFSPENLAFKILRRNGYLEKLYDYAIQQKVANLSLNEV
jgi:hypothetical protein